MQSDAMRTVKRTAIVVAATFALLAVGAIYMLYGWPRPPDTTDPAVFAGDGAQVNYCDLPLLDGNGARAADIPKAYTPDCGWTRWPMPVLADCREPLSPEAADLRGLWRSADAEAPHVERIEQCGDRVVVTAAGIIHDFHADGTLANGSRDIEPPSCFNTWVAIDWRDRVLNFRPFGGPVVLVTRRRDGENLLFKYPGRGERRLERICEVPQAARTPPART